MTPKAKKIITIGGVLAGSLIALLIAFYVAVRVSPRLQRQVDNWWVRSVAQAFEQAAQKDYKRAAKDTIGGQTPEETLRLYIEAVKRSDYRLASKYFVPDKQKYELQTFVGASEKDIENIQTLLKQALERGGSYSSDKNQYIIHRPIFVHLVRYPKGNWKFVEI